MPLHRARREPVGDDKRHVVAACVRRDLRLGSGCETAAEIGPHQISLPILRGAGRSDDIKSKGRKVCRELPLVEFVMHGVAGAGMGELEVEQRPGRERRAGALQADACAAQPAQLVPEAAVFALLRNGFVGHAVTP
jgi:hypothetical protein